jgi:hypothetical protein
VKKEVQQTIWFVALVSMIQGAWEREILVCVRERESIQTKIDTRYVRRGKGIRLSRGLSSGRGS